MEATTKSHEPTSDATSSMQTAVLLSSLSFGILGFVLPIYGKQLGASALEIGMLFSVFSLMTLILRPVVGRGVDRYGRKPFFVSGIACYAVAMGLFALASNLGLLYLARLMQGVGASLLWISAYTLATELNSSASRGQAVGGVDGASARGALLGALVGYGVLPQLGLDVGWTLLFAGYALAAAYGAWLGWKQVPETRREQLTSDTHAQGISSGLIRLMLIVGVTALSTALVGPLLMVFLQDKFTTDVGTLAWAFLPAAIIYGVLPSRAGRLSDRFGRAPLMAIGLAGSGLVSLLFPVLPNILLLVLLWAVEAIGLTMATPAQEAMVADLTGSDVRGQAYGIYTFAASLGATIGPLLGGWLYDQLGHAIPFYVNGIVLIVSAALVLLLLGGKTRSGMKIAGAA